MSTRYPMPYINYQRMREERAAQRKAATAEEKKPAPERERTPAPTSQRRLSWKEARELEDVENRISALEEEKAKLEEAVNEAGADYVLMQSLAEQLSAIEAELEDKMGRWLELSEIEH
jgi:ATP-binding cassette subfamily F protein uup